MNCNRPFRILPRESSVSLRIDPAGKGRITAFLVITFLLSGWSMTEKDDPRIAAVVIDPQQQPITMHWKAPDGSVFGNIGELDKWARATGRAVHFAMNGGMFTPAQAPVGLYVEEGVEFQGLDTGTVGSGNFRMQPNGVFGITRSGSAFVRTTGAYSTLGPVRYATQSGPMLLVKGVINSNFRAGSSNLHIRNGVGLLPNGSVLFAISKEPVNFHDFATFFKEQGCTEALYLDGAISRAVIPSAGIDQRNGVLGVLIAVIE